MGVSRLLSRMSERRGAHRRNHATDPAHTRAEASLGQPLTVRLFANTYWSAFSPRDAPECVPPVTLACSRRPEWHHLEAVLRYVHTMAETMSGVATPWSTRPSAKTKSAVQRSVIALLDELAPQRSPKRAEEPIGPIEQYRAPSGCVLQAPTCAVTVSWFADPTAEAAMGELHVRVWQGKVTRRGTQHGPKSAVMVSELILRPIESVLNYCLWGAPDGTQYDSAMLASKCSALLAAQIGAE